jgi:lipopolysaccharide assembly outer membrane protein LptD (OstA)
MTGLRKISLKTISLAFVTVALCAITWKSEAHRINPPEIYSTLTTDTIPKRKKVVEPSTRPAPSRPSTPNQQTTVPVQGNTQAPATQNPERTTTQSTPDTTSPAIDTFSLRLSKDTLDAPVDYEAEDSAVLLIKEQKFILYGKTKTSYQDINLTAPRVEMNQKTNVLTAYSSKDSLGNVITRAEFQQGEQKFQSDEIQFNFKTQKGVTSNTYTQEGEMLIIGRLTKKVDSATVFVREGYFTTCMLDHPHFAFKTNKMKIVSNKLAVSGPTHPEFEGVPVPIYLPFGFYPLRKGRHSGLLPPQFTANEDFGLGLEGLGYYHVLNDYVDITVRGNIYSFGGWSANLTPSYRKRYRYNGTFNLALQRTKFNFKGDPDYRLGKTFNVSWSHSVDPRARPGTTFSATVNAGSSRFNEFVPNNPYRNFSNQMQSSISYSKTWADKPYNLTLSANHNQNNNTRQVFITLPEANFSVQTIYPFQRKEILGAPKWYEKLGIGYNGSFRNQVSFYDSLFSFANLADTFQWGASHRLPITMTLPPIAGGKIIVSPSVSYEEQWLTNKIEWRYNQAKGRVDTVSMTKGFYTDRQVSFGLGLNTALYGTAKFGRTGITRIRHVVRPNVSFNYRPNLSKNNFQVLQLNPQGYRQAVPMFSNNLYSGFSYGRYGGLFFGIDNNLEMKWRGKKDSAEKTIRLIDGFGFTSGYNFLQDSMKLQPFNLYLRSTLFEKVSLTAQALLDPYQVNQLGQPVNRFEWQGDRFRLPRLTSGSIAMSTQFQSKPRDGSKPANENVDPLVNPITDPNTIQDQMRLQEYMRRNPAEFVDFNIPWSFDISYSLSFSKRQKPDYSGFETDVSSSFSFRSSFSLTPKWNFTTSGFYDFTTKEITNVNLSISRDMHCWQMSINLTPIGSYRSYNITLNPKASMLQDLRVNRTRYFTEY